MYAVLTSDSLSAYKDKKIKTIQDSQATQVRNHHYIYSDSKLLASVVYFAYPVKTSLWAVWAEQHTQYTETNLPLNEAKGLLS